MAEPFRRIGQGFCGTVWAADAAGVTSTLAMKREDGGPGRSLYNDYEMHLAVFRSLYARLSTASVPGCHQYVSSDHQAWWEDHLSRFPKTVQIPCNVLVTDRIPPFPKAVRNTIIDLYCPESLQSSIRSSEPDQDCLIRPYLGRRRHFQTQSRFKAFSLRNHPLHLDQIEGLGLDGTLYAKIMAETLAILYWEAHIDANDVEFVLAPPPKINRSKRFEGPLAHDTVIKSHSLGEHVVWILDFDCCKPLPLDEKGVDQAVTAFYKNDPFYPRPKRGDLGDQRLWTVFKDRFLETSESILTIGSPEAHLPALWVELVEHRANI